MDPHALTINSVRDGPACTRIPRGDLDHLATGGFPKQAALAPGDLTGRPGHGLSNSPRDNGTGQQGPAPAEPGAPFPAGTESCP